MDFYDFAWTNVFQITRKKREELKFLLRDNISFPILGKGEEGYVICLAKPKRLRDSLVSLHGMTFDSKNAKHRKILWHLFKASVYHLSLHAGISDFKIYADWAKDKEINLATYVVSTLEDAAINAYLRARWSPLIPDIAYANAISYLRLKPVSLIPNDTLRVMASTLSSFTTGMIKGTLPREILKDVNYLVTCLREIEDLTLKELRSGKKKGISSNSITDRKMKFVSRMYERLSRYGEPSEVPSLPYTEDHGMNYVFYENLIPAENEIKEVLKSALVTLGSKFEQDDFKERLFENEVSQVFSTWETRKRSQEKILKNYKLLGSNTHFSSFEFPQEDYTDYLRRKMYLAGPIRRILNRLRLLKNLFGDDYRHETGILDLQEAIQVVASKSPRTDVFTQETLQSMVEDWAILVDASRSLNYFHGEVRGIVLCLAEVANELLLDKTAWGVFAFSNKFYVVKDFSEVYYFDDCGGKLRVEPEAKSLLINLTDNSFYDVVFNSPIGKAVYELPPSESPADNLFLKGDNRVVINQSRFTMTQLYNSQGSEGPEVTLCYRPLVSSTMVGSNGGKPVNSLRIYVISLNPSQNITLQGNFHLGIACLNVTSSPRSYDFSYQINSLLVKVDFDGATGEVSLPISSSAEGALVNVEIVTCDVRLQRVGA